MDSLDSCRHSLFVHIPCRLKQCMCLILEIDKLGDKYGIFLPKGANYYVEDVGIKLVEKYGVNVLKEVAKLNFSNTDRILKEVRK